MHSYQRQQQVKGGSFRYITALLPAAATDIYYRDQIGNISTSHLREEVCTLQGAIRSGLIPSRMAWRRARAW